MKLRLILLAIGLVLSVVLIVKEVSAGQLVITEHGFKSSNSFTLPINETAGDVERECILVATRISDEKYAYDSSTIHNHQIHQTHFSWTSIEYLCMRDDGHVAGSGRIYQIPWQGQTMCVEWGEWSGLGLRDKCDGHPWASRTLVLELYDSFRKYVQEWK